MFYFYPILFLFQNTNNMSLTALKYSGARYFGKSSCVTQAWSLYDDDLRVENCLTVPAKCSAL